MTTKKKKQRLAVELGWLRSRYFWGSVIVTVSSLCNFHPPEPKGRASDGASDRASCQVSYVKNDRDEELISKSCVQRLSNTDEVDISVVYTKQQFGRLQIKMVEPTPSGGLIKGMVIINDEQGVYTFNSKQRLFKAYLNNGNSLRITNLNIDY